MAAQTMNSAYRRKPVSPMKKFKSKHKRPFMIISNGSDPIQVVPTNNGTELIMAATCTHYICPFDI